MTTVGDVALLTLAPTILMTIGAIIVQFYSPGPKLVSAFQHFSSGIILAALASELCPKIQTAILDGTNGLSRREGVVMFIVGFSIGFVFLIGVGRVMEYFESKQEEEEEDGHDNKEEGSRPEPLADAVASSEQVDINATSTDTKSHHENVSLCDPSSLRKLPWGLLAVVTIDAFMDGALIGLSAHAGEKMGLMITVALSVEMTFLGITTSGSMVKKGISRGTAVGVCVVIPLFLMVGGLIGSTICASLSPSGLIAGLSFGAAALIYLVTDELLVEAHEQIELDTWYVTAHLFLGFMGGMVFTLLNE
eukprot:PhF_6_TR40927/c0_g1_i2/m.61911/K07238/TC.ZIP, zupT, ZRT3, ZIP2; zinc transporter, ZIP family